MKFKTVIVEDEMHSLDRLKTLLRDFEEIEIIGEAHDGESAIALLEELKPDLVFLDIQLPVYNGFDVLEQLSFHPEVIFVTSYNDYAIRAFEENAVDYILKPTSKERLEVSIKRIVEKRGIQYDRILNLLKNRIFPDYVNRFTVRIRDDILVIPGDNVYYFKAEDRYVFLGTMKNEYIYDSTLRELEESLDPQKFIRVSKSYIVSTDKILKFSKWFLGDYYLKLTDIKKTTIKIGRKYLPELRTKFNF